MTLRKLLLISLLFAWAGDASGRTWTETASGKQIEAEFISADAERVTIALGSGQRFTLELARLSPEDREFVMEELKPKIEPSEDRFDDMPRLKADEIPSEGTEHAALKAADTAIRAFMVEKGIGAVTFAVSQGDEILHDRAFGWADADLKQPLTTGVKMRVASLTKPVVQAAIRTLISEGKLAESDSVFAVLNLAQYEEAEDCDERWQLITVGHLLDHKGGWDRDASGDFTYDSKIGDTFRVDPDGLTSEHVVRYGLTKPLDFDPGDRYAYCNFGYILLVRVIETISGQSFDDYLQDTVCGVADAPTFSLSRSDARDRQSGEIWYCYHPEYPRKTVPLPLRVKARDGAGAVACTAADYCRFLEHYSMKGDLRRTGGRYRGAFSGSHPGVTAICSQRADGINYVVLCNRRSARGSEWNDELRTVVDLEIEKAAASLP